jgi:hypothetical protein
VLARVLLEIVLDEKARDRDRISAASVLWDRGWGRPAMYAEIEAADPLGMDEVGEAVARVADELRDKRESKAASTT